MGLVNEQVRVDRNSTYESMKRTPEVVRAAHSTYVPNSSAVVSVESVAESLVKKVRLHKLDLDEIIARTRELLSEAGAD